MEPLTGKERVCRQLRHLPVDRIAVMEQFWNFTIRNWVEAGKMPAGVSASEHFNLDIDLSWSFNLKVEPHKRDELVAEDEDTCTYLDGNGATLRRYKTHDSTPEHIGYRVADRAGWEEFAKPFLIPSPDRIDFEGYRRTRRICEEQGRFFCWAGVNIFESIHPLCGHENYLMGMALDPEWVLDMGRTYADMCIGM